MTRCFPRAISPRALVPVSIDAHLPSNESAVPPNPLMQSPAETPSEPRDLKRAIQRGALGRCPNCGKGRLFRAYLKQVERCAACCEAFGHIRADDGPPWLTTIIVGHVVVAIAMTVEAYATWPQWWSIVLFCTLALALALIVLPRAKGIFIGAIWASKLAKPDEV